MKKTIVITVVTLMAMIFITSGVKAQDHSNKAKSNQHMMKMNTPSNKTVRDSSKMMNNMGMMNNAKMKKTTKGMMNGNNKMGSGNNMSSGMIHKGIIDVNSIDKNKDGKVYQDMMDWNVISDKPGKCPNCGMTLQEVSVEKAKKNLKKHGYKTK